MYRLEEPPLTEPHITSVVFPSKFIKSTQSRTFKTTAVVKVTTPGYYDETVVFDLRLKEITLLFQVVISGINFD